MVRRGIIPQSCMSRLLSKLNGNTQHAYHYCMNWLNGFRTGSARDKHYEYCSSNGHVKVNMPNEKEKWLKLHDSLYQFKVPFMLYADIKCILKLVDEQFKEKMNTMKAERKVKTPYTEKINTHVPSGWCVHSTFAYGDVLDPLTMFPGKDWGKVRRIHKRRGKAVAGNISTAAHDRTYRYVERFSDPQNKKIRNHCHCTSLYRGAAHNNCNLKY